MNKKSNYPELDKLNLLLWGSDWQVINSKKRLIIFLCIAFGLPIIVYLFGFQDWLTR